MKRRLEVRAEIGGITIIDDFAHHPTAIAATLGALRTRYAGRRLWAILEPRSNTLRRNVFQHELVESLALADQVVIASVFFKATDTLKPGGAAGREQRGRGTQSTRRCRRAVCRRCGDCEQRCARRLAAGDVVAILSNGGFGGIYEKLPAALQLHAR